MSLTQIFWVLCKFIKTVVTFNSNFFSPQAWTSIWQFKNITKNYILKIKPFFFQSTFIFVFYKQKRGVEGWESWQWQITCSFVFLFNLGGPCAVPCCAVTQPHVLRSHCSSSQQSPLLHHFGLWHKAGRDILSKCWCHSCGESNKAKWTTGASSSKKLWNSEIIVI